MSDSKGLLVLRYPMALPVETIDRLIEQINPIADELGVQPLVLGDGADARLEYGASALLERVCVALEEIAAQGRAPEVSEAQNAPQALNARATGLNSRPVQDGLYHGVDCRPASSEGTLLLQKGERVVPRG
jgi:hypothetical protein